MIEIKKFLLNTYTILSLLKLGKFKLKLITWNRRVWNYPRDVSCGVRVENVFRSHGCCGGGVRQFASSKAAE